ncbi:MAG: Hpt domain-containing protein [Sphingomonas sp.]|uniref:Hpt domain-containing protein n=1 Tax=Sphingomonas sp. TaxID=28214 RepID=UPI0017E54F94|nr:Hpt domain-containing protein [Sphingomonas sp.]
MAYERSKLVDWDAFATARTQLGGGFVRILGYFQEDGTKSVDAIETAMRAKNAAALVIPAHTLKGEARQFGAEPLAEAAETIEMIARKCVETHDSPDEALATVVGLRELFNDTLVLLLREANPLVERRPGFGRRAVGGFGQG